MTFGQKIILCQFWLMKDSLNLGGYSEQTIFQANIWRKTKFYPNWHFCFEWRMELGRQWGGRLVPLRCCVQDEWNVGILCPDLLTGVWAWGVGNTYFPLFVKGPGWARWQLELTSEGPVWKARVYHMRKAVGMSPGQLFTMPSWVSIASKSFQYNWKHVLKYAFS